MSNDPLTTPPAEAGRVFGDRLDLAIRYAEALATTGAERGLIGPRETERLWERHLVNSAVVGELTPPDATVIDVGSGAGLPGIPLALARPDLRLILVEPLQRRYDFLREVCQDLSLAVDVVRGRAEDLDRTAGVVTARAVAPLHRLVPWCLPLLSPGGSLLAIKGQSAREEVARDRTAIRRAGGVIHGVRCCGVGLVDPPTTVVVIGQRSGTR